MKSVIILGGGITGLSTAYYLTKLTKLPLGRIILLESTNRVGGCVKTERFDDGAIFEQGPRSVRSSNEKGHNILEMVEDLGLTDSILSINRQHPATKNRYIYAKGHMFPIPTGPGGIIAKKPPFSKSLLSYGMKEPFQVCKKVDDETVDSFFRRRLGAEVADYAVDCLCRGVYSGSSQQLSMKACFPGMLSWEQKYGSILMGAIRSKKEKPPPLTSALVRRYKDERWSMWSLQNGLADLPNRLKEHLLQQPGVEIHQMAPCTGLRVGKHRATVRWGDTEEDADYIFSAIPAKELAPLMSADHSVVSEWLRTIPFASVAVCSLQYHGQLFPKQAFGHLIPSSETSKIMGMLYDSCIFPDHNGSISPTTKITCMMGGAWFTELFGDEDKADPENLTRFALESVRQQLNIRGTPFRAFTVIRKKKMPQYVVGHTKIIDKLFGYIKTNELPLSLVGASYEGGSINDCIHNAKHEVQRILARQ